MAQHEMHPDYQGDRFAGLIPGMAALEGDWSVDGPNVAVGSSNKTMLEWMADAKRPQPLMMADGEGAIDEATPRPTQPSNSSQPSTAFPPGTPYPNEAISPPTLSYDFRLCVAMDPSVCIGGSSFHDKTWFSFVRGQWSASFGSGTVVPGGQEIQSSNASDGYTRLEANYLLQTNDEPPAFIKAATTGWITEPSNFLDAPKDLRSIDSSTYKFKIFVDLETGDHRYQNHVNRGMWVGSGIRKGPDVIYDAFRVS